MACTKYLQLTVMSDVKSSVCIPWIFGIRAFFTVYAVMEYFMIPLLGRIVM